MVHLGLKANFKHQVIQWDNDAAPIKDPMSLIGQTCLNSRDKRGVVMKTAEPVSVR